MTRRNKLATLPATSCDIAGAGPQHDATTSHDTARCHGLCSQAVLGCAPGASNLVWTQCTVSESPFGTLFMNIVHEHCSQNFSKKKKRNTFFKKNKIK